VWSFLTLWKKFFFFKVCPTDTDFLGLSRSTRCGCCSYQVSSISVRSYDASWSLMKEITKILKSPLTSWNIVGIFTVVCGSFWRVDKIENGGRCHGNQAFSIQSRRSCYATLHLCQCPFYKIFVKFRNNSLLKMTCDPTQHLCQRSFYKIFVKFRNSKKNVLKISQLL
jgi:hypothetical protein